MNEVIQSINSIEQKNKELMYSVISTANTARVKRFCIFKGNVKYPEYEGTFTNDDEKKVDWKQFVKNLIDEDRCMKFPNDGDNEIYLVRLKNGLYDKLSLDIPRNLGFFHTPSRGGYHLKYWIYHFFSLNS